MALLQSVFSHEIVTVHTVVSELVFVIGKVRVAPIKAMTVL